MLSVGSRYRFRHWPLRARMALLLLCACALPLLLLGVLDVREARDRLFNDEAQLLATHGDNLSQDIDAFNTGYLRAVNKLAVLPLSQDFCTAGTAQHAQLVPVLQKTLAALTSVDPMIRGMAIVDITGQVVADTDRGEIGKPLAANFEEIRQALAGHGGMSDVFMAITPQGELPTVAYTSPILAEDRRVVGAAVEWVRAAGLSQVARSTTDLAGESSFAVLYDQHGIRILTSRADLLFTPAGPLDPQLIEQLSAYRHFGADTRQRLQNVQPFHPVFEIARAPTVNPALFRGDAPQTGGYYAVARRLATSPWTVFLIIPQRILEQQIQRAMWERGLFVLATLIVALALGAWFARGVLSPVRRLAIATSALRSGDLSVRAQIAREDELGRLGANFDAMAERIETQARSLKMANDELEVRVVQRTAELTRTTQSLEREVAERRQAEEALRASEQRLAITLDSIGDAVIATDLDGCVMRMNPVAEQLTGWSLAEVRGWPLDEVFHVISEATGERVVSPVDRVLREGIVVGLANHTLLRSRSGVEFPIADSGAPIRGLDGRVRGVVLVFRDQTREREMEQALMRSVRLEALNQQAVEANRIKSEFLAGVSHELRTPLNAIIGFTELIHDGHVTGESPQYQEFLGDILTGSRQVLQLINDILDLSKVEAGKIVFQPQPVDPLALIREVIGVLRSAAMAKGIRIEVDVDSNIGQLVLDPVRFKQVLYNYLSNALKFTPSQGRVQVRLLPESDTAWFRLEVQDTGTGIAVDDVSRLFVEFQQVGASAGSAIGTGLGLALTRRLVEAQNGRVGVISASGRGSTFYAILPRVPLSAAA